MIYHKMGKPNQYRRLSKNFLVLDAIGSLFPDSLIPSDSVLSCYFLFILQEMQMWKKNQAFHYFTLCKTKTKTNITDVTEEKPMGREGTVYVKHSHYHIYFKRIVKNLMGLAEIKPFPQSSQPKRYQDAELLQWFIRTHNVQAHSQI